MKMQELCMSMLHKIWFMWCNIYSLHNIDYNITSFTISIMNACATDFGHSIYHSLIMLDSIWGIIDSSIFKLNDDFNNLEHLSIAKYWAMFCSSNTMSKQGTGFHGYPCNIAPLLLTRWAWHCKQNAVYPLNG